MKNIVVLLIFLFVCFSASAQVKMPKWVKVDGQAKLLGIKSFEEWQPSLFDTTTHNEYVVINRGLVVFHRYYHFSGACAKETILLNGCDEPILVEFRNVFWEIGSGSAILINTSILPRRWKKTNCLQIFDKELKILQPASVKYQGLPDK